MTNSCEAQFTVNLSYSLIEETAVNNKPYLFFIHGAQSNGNTWKTTIAALKSEYKIVVIHLRGHGNSPFGNGRFSLEDMVADIKLLIDKLNLAGKLVFVAHSMGSRIANSFAAKYPKYLLGLIIEDLGLQALNDPIISSTKEQIKRFQDFPTSYKSLEAAQKSLEACGYSRSRTVNWIEDGRITYDQNSQIFHVTLNPYVTYLTYTSILAFPDKAFKRIDASIPIAVLGAADHVYFPIEERENMQKIRPSIKRFDVSDSDHSIHKSNPLAFLKILKDFVKDLSF